MESEELSNPEDETEESEGHNNSLASISDNENTVVLEEEEEKVENSIEQNIGNNLNSTSENEAHAIEPTATVSKESNTASPDDNSEDFHTIVLTRSNKIYIRKPKDLPWCKAISSTQIFTLLLIPLLYLYLLFIEDRTFGWQEALGVYGLKLEVISRKCDAIKTFLIPTVLPMNDGKVQVETYQVNDELCETHYISTLRIQFHLFVIVVATFSNILFSAGKTLKNITQILIATLVLSFYLGMSTWYLFIPMVRSYNSAYSSHLSEEMYRDLSRAFVSPDHISSTWTLTQLKSHCCGGTGPTEWDMNPPGHYHSSCLDTDIYKYQEMTNLKFPKLSEVWQSGCLDVEHHKLAWYAKGIIALLGIQLICCSILIFSFVYAPLAVTLPLNATYSFTYGVHKRKAFITIRGNYKQYSYSANSKRFIIWVDDVHSSDLVKEEVNIQKISPMLYSTYLIQLYSPNNLLEFQADISASSSFIQSIRVIKDIKKDCNFLKITNGPIHIDTAPN